MSTYNSPGELFAEDVLNHLVGPQGRFESYSQVEGAGGPSPTSLVRLRKIRDGEVQMKTTPRQSLFDAIDAALEREGAAREMWESAMARSVIYSSWNEDSLMESDRQELTSLREELAGRMAENVKLSAENAALKQEVEKLKRGLADLRKIIAKLV